MNKLIHIGFGNIVNADKIISIVSPDAAPIKRMVQKAREEGKSVDATQGRKTKALSALLPETICNRAISESENSQDET